MSYDFYIDGNYCQECKRGDTIAERNYTSNVSGMWYAAIDGGLIQWGYEKGPVLLGDIASKLESGVKHMRANEEALVKLEPSNGWGNYKGALDVLEWLLGYSRTNPGAYLRISY